MTLSANYESAISREHVGVAYIDALQSGLGHEKAFREALQQGVRSLLSRFTMDLREVSEERLFDAAWTRLAPFVEAFAEISDDERRETRVLGTVVRAVGEAALALRAELPQANQPREAVRVTTVAVG